jgi:hypothetical protein
LDIDKLFLPFVDKYLSQCREKLKEWSQAVRLTTAALARTGIRQRPLTVVRIVVSWQAFKNDDWVPIDSEEEDEDLRILHSVRLSPFFHAA